MSACSSIHCSERNIAQMQATYVWVCLAVDISRSRNPQGQYPLQGQTQGQVLDASPYFWFFFYSPYILNHSYYSFWHQNHLMRWLHWHVFHPFPSTLIRFWKLQNKKVACKISISPVVKKKVILFLPQPAYNKLP